MSVGDFRPQGRQFRRSVQGHESDLINYTGRCLNGPSDAVFVAQIVLLLLIARLLGELMQRIGQPAVMGQLLAGIILGPSVFGAICRRRGALTLPQGPSKRQ